ncbi:GNAT family N-acetyltransferase [Corynebacterium variabile]|uniref:GNAT family N-acetyltransferase n=1 Tax=Corynebacterium variabile TaxID=1727 RepID=UPI00289CB9DC|nr:GNAT family N-acetyltransferase [Corynebacterium variabile]
MTSPSTSPLSLRFPVTGDETRARELNAAFSADGFDFLAGGGYLGDPGTDDDGTGSGTNADWMDFLDSVRRQHEGTDLPPDRVPADFLLAEITADDGTRTLIGRTSIRYGLTDHLLNFGGHIGYAVAPEFRRRGYATEILRQSLALLAERGIDKALITCDENNVGSIGVIEANGGVLDDRRTNPDGTLIRRYWIELSPEPVTR